MRRHLYTSITHIISEQVQVAMVADELSIMILHLAKQLIHQLLVRRLGLYE